MKIKKNKLYAHLQDVSNHIIEYISYIFDHRVNMKIPKSSAYIQNLPYHILVEYHFSSENEDTYLQDMPKHTL